MTYISKVWFDDEVYEFYSGFYPTLGNLAYWMWERFDYEEDTCFYLDGMSVLEIKEYKG